MLITTRKNQEDIWRLVSHRAVEKLNLKTFILSCDCCEANHALSQKKKNHCKSKSKAERWAGNTGTSNFSKFSGGIFSVALKIGELPLTWSFLKYKMPTLSFLRHWDWMAYILGSSEVVLMLSLSGKDAALSRPKACNLYFLWLLAFASYLALKARLYLTTLDGFDIDFT